MREFDLNDNQIAILRDVCIKRYKLLGGTFLTLPAFLASSLIFPIGDEERTFAIGTFNICISSAIVLLIAILYFKKVVPIQKDIIPT